MKHSVEVQRVVDDNVVPVTSDHGYRHLPQHPTRTAAPVAPHPYPPPHPRSLAPAAEQEKIMKHSVEVKRVVDDNVVPVTSDHGYRHPPHQRSDHVAQPEHHTAQLHPPY